MNDPVVTINECDTIKCSNCDKALMIIKNYKQNNQKQQEFNLATKLQVECPFCCDHSYVYQFNGTFGYHPAVGVAIKSCEQKNDVMKFMTSKRG